MVITKYFTNFSQSYRINLRGNDLGEITISRHMSMDSTPTWSPAYINWCSCGEKSPKDTLTFTEALTVARHLAECLDNQQTPSVAITE